MPPKKTSTTRKTTTTTSRRVEEERRAEELAEQQRAAETESEQIVQQPDDGPPDGQTAETRPRSRSRPPATRTHWTVADIAMQYSADEKYRARTTGFFVTTASAPANSQLTSNINELMQMHTADNNGTGRDVHVPATQDCK